jgi:hypothetical protein
MKRWFFTLAVVLFTQNFSFANNPTQGTLCQQDEKVFFSCPLKEGKKIVSLCGSTSLTTTEGYLQYRFGEAGKVELEFPRQRQETWKLFRYSHYFRYQVERTTVSFDNNGYRYMIFDHYEGDTQPKVQQQGVEVTPPGAGQQAVTLLCRGAASGDLNSLNAIIPCDKDDPLNMGECR